LPTRPVLLDDRVLVGLLVGEQLPLARNPSRFTTTYFYFRACRSFVLGGSGKLSGPFARLDDERKAAVLGQMLALPEEVSLPDPRRMVPVMVGVQRRHPHLNVLHTEAVAAALMLGTRMLLSAPTASGQLRGVLETEGIPWQVVELP
jgi:hypothetical protein